MNRFCKEQFMFKSLHLLSHPHFRISMTTINKAKQNLSTKWVPCFRREDFKCCLGIFNPLAAFNINIISKDIITKAEFISEAYTVSITEICKYTISIAAPISVFRLDLWFLCVTYSAILSSLIYLS